MVDRAGTIQRFAGALAGPVLVLVVSGCAAGSPSTTSHSATPRALASASLNPDENIAAAWTATGSMDGIRREHTATLLPDGKVLVTGGLSRGVDFVLASAELYDPSSGSWTATGNMIEARSLHTATLLPDGKVLVAGGLGSRGSDRLFGIALASAELYDPSSGSWTATGNMEAARANHTATLLRDGTVLAAGGSALASAELYDPNSGSWTATRSMVMPREQHTATLLRDGTVLAAGGSALASAELYDPNSGTWIATEDVGVARYDHTATLLPDGQVLVTGGRRTDCCGKPRVSAQMYDPNSGSWTATQSTITPRQQHTATLLPDGRLLVAAGFGSSSLLASAELYDPNSGSWTATAEMLDSRYNHTATLLPDGKVLVAGGTRNAIGEALASAELYDPGTGS